MKQAGICLISLLRNEKVQKRPECRVPLERPSSEVLFCPDLETRTLLVHFLSKNQNSQEALPDDYEAEYLASTYGIQTLEMNKAIYSQSLHGLVKLGTFQRVKVHDLMWRVPPNTEIFLHSLSLCGKSRS